jgi:hypothetical protein
VTLEALRGVQSPNRFTIQEGLGVLDALRIELTPRLTHPVAEMGSENGVA